MKLHLSIFLFYVFATLTTTAQKTSPKSKPKWGGIPNFDSLYRGKPYTNFNLTTLDGKAINNDNSIGKVTILNFWFESCMGCRAEFAELNELYSRLKNDLKCQFVAVTFDEAASLPSFIKQYNLNYPIATTGDHTAFHKLNYGMGCPSLIIVDKNGVIATIGGYAVTIKDEKGRYDISIDKLLQQVKDLE